MLFTTNNIYMLHLGVVVKILQDFTPTLVWELAIAKYFSAWADN